ncbi:MAG: hypothetical protein ACOYMG_24890 [Candidatus Methylumidiphilus sp.]
MASPAPKPPAGSHDTEALDILRRLEPTLARMETEQRRQADAITKLDDRQRKQGEDITELKGRMAGIEGQLRQIPTLYQLAGLIFAIFGAAFVLIRFASGHG